MNAYRRMLAPLAALALLLALGSSASAQIFIDRLNHPNTCPPCDHPYFGYYPTCWRMFPAGWHSQCPPAHQPAAQTGHEPGKPPSEKNGHELLPPPTPVARRGGVLGLWR